MLKGKELGKAIEVAIQRKIDSGAAQSKAEIARHFGIQAPSIHDWIKKGSISKDKLQKLFQYFSDVVPPEHWGLSGLAGMMASLDANVSPGPDIKSNQIPLISWVQAGFFCAAPDLLAPGDAEKWLPSHKNHGSHTYALRVQGSSMVSPYPGQRSYPEGTIIYVDPDRAITNGCRVVVRIHDSEEATFKEYVEDAGKRYLRPLNPQFPTIEMTKEMQICGVVVLATMEE